MGGEKRFSKQQRVGEGKGFPDADTKNLRYWKDGVPSKGNGEVDKRGECRGKDSEVSFRRVFVTSVVNVQWLAMCN